MYFGRPLRAGLSATPLRYGPTGSSRWSLGYHPCRWQCHPSGRWGQVPTTQAQTTCPHLPADRRQRDRQSALKPTHYCPDASPTARPHAANSQGRRLLASPTPKRSGCGPPHTAQTHGPRVASCAARPTGRAARPALPAHRLAQAFRVAIGLGRLRPDASPRAGRHAARPAARQPSAHRAARRPPQTSRPGGGRRFHSRHSLRDAALRSFVAPFLRSSFPTLAALRSLWSLQRRPAPLSAAPIRRLLGHSYFGPFCASGEPLPLVGLTLRYLASPGSSGFSHTGLTCSRWSGSALDTTDSNLTPACRTAAAQPGQPPAITCPRQAARRPSPSQPPRRQRLPTFRTSLRCSAARASACRTNKARFAESFIGECPKPPLPCPG